MLSSAMGHLQLLSSSRNHRMNGSDEQLKTSDFNLHLNVYNLQYFSS